MVTSAVHPFSLEETIETEEWLVWQKAMHVFPFTQEKKTDGRYESAKAGYSNWTRQDESASNVAKCIVQRNQYNAILSRFETATKRASHFSSWNT